MDWWNKNTLFERSCRVPLIVAAPGAKAGRVSRSLVELVDLYPTVVEYCQLRAPHDLAGQSLRPLLEDPSRKGKDAAFTFVARGKDEYGQAVRTDRWRCIQWTDGSTELYDHTKDKQETNNLARDPQHAATVRRLRGLLKTIGPPPSLK